MRPNISNNVSCLTCVPFSFRHGKALARLAAAGLLLDCILFPKGSPQRNQPSLLTAGAVGILQELVWPPDKIEIVAGPSAAKATPPDFRQNQQKTVHSRTRTTSMQTASPALFQLLAEYHAALRSHRPNRNRTHLRRPALCPGSLSTRTPQAARQLHRLPLVKLLLNRMLRCSKPSI